MTVELTNPTAADAAPRTARSKRRTATDFAAEGEPFVWALGGALAIGILMIVGFLLLTLTARFIPVLSTGGAKSPALSATNPL